MKYHPMGVDSLMDFGLILIETIDKEHEVQGGVLGDGNKWIAHFDTQTRVNPNVPVQ